MISNLEPNKTTEAALRDCDAGKLHRWWAYEIRQAVRDYFTPIIWIWRKLTNRTPQ